MQIKKKKLKWFVHVVRAKGTLSNMVLQGTEGTRKGGILLDNGQVTSVGGQDFLSVSSAILLRSSTGGGCW